MADNIYQEITKQHSTTFYYATLFFSKKIREDVFVLYAFLRTADDIVDEKKDKKEFLEFREEVFKSFETSYTSQNPIISSFVDVCRKYKFQKDYLDSFFESLESDFVNPLQIKNKNELQNYIYGVAGVVGLMMAKMMHLPDTLQNSAREFGELMQLVNIMRDIKEDYTNGRVYIPQDTIDQYDLKTITDYQNNPTNFESLVRSEIENIQTNLDKLSEDIQKIPQPYRRAIKISRDVYRVISQKIYKDPTIVWQKRVYVSKFQLIWIILKNLL